MFRHKSHVLSQYHLIPSSTKLYQPSITEYQPVPSHTQNHQEQTSSAFYWPSTIIYQPVPLPTDPVPPGTKHYRLLLTQYHHISTSAATFWPSTTKYQPVPPSPNPVPSYINQDCPILTQSHQVPPLISLFATHLMSHAQYIFGLAFFSFSISNFLRQIFSSFFSNFNYLTFLCQPEMSTVVR